MHIGIVLAGGSSQRMNHKCSLPKQFLEVRDRPVIAYTLDLLQNDPLIDGIAVTLRREYFPLLDEIKRNNGFTKIKWIIESGDQRHDSLYNVLKHLEGYCKDEDIVVSLSAVTPIIAGSVIRQSIEAADEFGAAVAATPLRSTLLIAGADMDIICVPDRRNYRIITEPHTYRFGVIKSTYDKAFSDGCINDAMTDDVQLFDHYGICQKIIEGNTDFIKITYRNDLKVLEQFLIDQEGASPEGI